MLTIMAIIGLIVGLALGFDRFEDSGEKDYSLTWQGDVEIGDMSSMEDLVFSEVVSTSSPDSDESEEELEETDEDVDPFYGRFYAKNDLTDTLGGKRMHVEWEMQATFISAAETRTIIGEELFARLEQVSIHCDQTSEYTKPEQCNIYLYRTGTVTAPSVVAGNVVYTAYIYDGEMGANYYPYHIISERDTQNVVYLGVPSKWKISRMFDSFINVNKITPEAPEKLIYGDAVLVYSNSAHTIYDSERATENEYQYSQKVKNLGGIVDVTAGETVNMKDFLNNHRLLKQYPEGALYLVDGDIYVLLAEDGGMYFYRIIPEQLVERSWAKEHTPYPLYETGFAYADEKTMPKLLPAGRIGRVMCGSGYLINSNVATKLEGFSDHIDELTPFAYTSHRERLLFTMPRNVANDMKAYKELFDFGFDGMTSRMKMKSEENYGFESMSDAEKWEYFLNDVTLVYWKDPEGTWRVFRSELYESMAECGKPVVYLYPEQTQDVSVTIEPKGGFTKTIPAPVGNTWKVKASPNSELYYYEDGQTYPYIFWESKSDEGSVPEQGFVMAKDDVPAEMDQLLSDAGLNTQEKKDFMEFWQPFLQDSPYVFVTFVAQSEIDMVAPMSVTPSPDYMLRVFMYYEPLQKPIDVKPLPIHVSPRHGFSVIEWGGVLHEGYKGE